jgi:hypothetical protein
VILLALGVVTSGCAAPGTDFHLAPLYTRMHTADGGVVVEALGGLFRQHRRSDDGFLQWRTVFPLIGSRHQRNGDYDAHHPFPVSKTRRRGSETVSYFVPLYLYTDKPDRKDGVQTQRLAMLPGFLFESKQGQTLLFGWFPFIGRVEDILTIDRVVFFLWPLFVYAERDGRFSYHFIWPFFGWTYGNGEKSWHVFPLAAHARLEGRYDRWYFLWPIFHWQRNYLGGGDEQPERVWWVWPLFGHKSRGTYDAWTTLWPFFGYSRDPRSGFWGLDFPFPLVRLQRGPGDKSRTRFWPIYSHLHAEGLDATSYLWPIFHVRHEETWLSERDAFFIVPFWQTWDRTDKQTGETSSWRKLWPLFRHERVGEWRHDALFDLDPFARTDLVPAYLTGFLHLYDWETQRPVGPEDEGFRRERSFLGLYRRERGRGEDRRSFAGLWARRRHEEDGRAVHETSLLFGLLRWRVTEGSGFDMLPPAVPGPGWPQPLERSAATESRTFF